MGIASTRANKSSRGQRLLRKRKEKTACDRLGTHQRKEPQSGLAVRGEQGTGSAGTLTVVGCLRQDNRPLGGDIGGRFIDPPLRSAAACPGGDKRRPKEVLSSGNSSSAEALLTSVVVITPIGSDPHREMSSRISSSYSWLPRVRPDEIVTSPDPNDHWYRKDRATPPACQQHARTPWRLQDPSEPTFSNRR